MKKIYAWEPWFFMFDVNSPYWNIVWGFFIALGAFVFCLGMKLLKQRKWQMTAIFMIGNIFDRLFIDEFWVGHTKAWFIPGTEDLMPYIPVKVKIKKWIGNLIMFPLLSALIAGAVTLFAK